MFKNYLTTAIRSLLKHKTFSIINIIGLAVSMAVCLVMISLLTDQLTIDGFHVHKDRIYRIITHSTYNGNPSSSYATSPGPLAPYILKGQSGVTSAVRMAEIRDHLDIDAGNKILPITGLYAEKDFFQLFSFELIEGNPASALESPFSLVLTSSSATKLFGFENALNKVVTIDGVGEFTITGIAKDPPKNSHIQFNSIRSYATIPVLEKGEDFRNITEDWKNVYLGYNYLLLDKETNPNLLDPVLALASEQHYQDAHPLKATFELQPFVDISPTRTDLSNNLGMSVPWVGLLGLSGLALVVMFSACFNYGNSSIARSLLRAKEVGIRKVSGADKKHILIQFICESILIALIALIAAFLIYKFLVPAFYGLDPHIPQIIRLNTTTAIVMYFVLFAIFIGLLAGIIPAIYMSKMNTLQVLKKLNSLKLVKGITIRKALVVIQFTLSLIFIITATIVYQQFKYSMAFDLGFDRENIINIDLKGNDFTKFKNEFSKIPEIQSISFCGFLPGIGRVRTGETKYKDQADSTSLAFIPVDQNFITNLNVPIIAGSSFPEVMPDSSEQYIVVNQEVLKRFSIGSPEEAINEILEVEGQPLQIIGVMGNFYYDRIDNTQHSFGFRYIPKDLRVANLKVKSSDMEYTLNKMRSSWLAIDEVHEMDYDFFEDDIEEAYVQFIVITKIVGFCAFLAIVLAGLGLFGMAIYTTQSRIKEIGVRKVLGASVAGLVYLLSKGFVLILLLASLIAIPTAYLLNGVWLAEMANRVNVGWMILGSGTIVMFGLGVLTIASQTVKAALANPVKSLKDE